MAATVYSGSRRKKTWFRGCRCQSNSKYTVEEGEKAGGVQWREGEKAGGVQWRVWEKVGEVQWRERMCLIGGP